MTVRRIDSLDRQFPRRLRYPKGPDQVEVAGPLARDLDLLPAPVAIVGTRRPDADAWRYAHWLAATLARKGATIVSGGAYGIDAAAHEGALSVRGRTVAVLPTSVDRFSPAGNAALFRRIVVEGGLVGFLSRDERPRFHERNAAIAALADHVVVVSAPLESGARNTALEARRFGRALWIVPGAPWEPTMQGNVLELRDTARPLVSPLPILAALGLDQSQVADDKGVLWSRPWSDAPFDPNPAPAPRVTSARTAASPSSPPHFPQPAPPPRDRRAPAVAARPATAASLLPAPEERKLIEALREGPKTPDQLVLATGLPVGAVRALLLTWTVEGTTREGPFGVFRLANS